MAKLILILGWLQIAAGILAFAVSKSAVHEILVAIAFGFGVLSVGVSVIITKIDDAVKGK